MRVRNAWSRWASRQDVTTLSSLGDVRSWLSASALALALVAVGAWIPMTARHLELEARPALIAFGLAASGGFGLAIVHEQGRLYSPGEIMSVLWTSSMLQLFCAILIARSSMLGAVIFFPLLLFTSAMHGFLLRSTWREPFPTAGTAVATVIGMTLGRSVEQVVLLGLAGLLGVITSLLLGTLAVRTDDNRRRREQLRAAIAAQQLHEQMAKVHALSESLVHVMGSAHDMANAVSLVRLSRNLLLTLRDAVPEDRHGVLEKIERSLEMSTGRIDQMLSEIRTRKTTAGGTTTTVKATRIAAVAHRVVESLAPRFSGATIELEIAEDIEVEVAGGSPTLERVLENLVLNALQGDGHHGAEHVRLHATNDARARALSITVDDDGPGFPHEHLSRPPTAFSSSKPEGTGIGLYTVDRLVRASGGTLSLENRAPRGARACVTLPRSPP